MESGMIFTEKMQICKCHSLPPDGKFTVGNQYPWRCIIDGVAVTDDDQAEYYFNEIKWLWYFTKM